MPELRETKMALMVLKYGLLTGTISVLIAACGSTRWFVSTTLEIELGLWKACSRGVCIKIHEELVDTISEKNEFRAARAFMILAVLVSIAWAIISLFGEFLEGRQVIGKAEVTLGCVTVVMAIATGMSYLGYGEFSRNKGLSTFGKYSIGFALVWVAVLLAICTTVVSYSHAKHKQCHNEGEQPGMFNPSLFDNAPPMATTV